MERLNVATDVRRFQVVAGYQQHQIRSKSHPPARWFDFRYRGSGFTGLLLRVCLQRRTAKGEQKAQRKQPHSQGIALIRVSEEARKSFFHSGSIRGKRPCCQSRFLLLMREDAHFCGEEGAAKTRWPNASGTWKFGAGVRVGRQAE